MIEPLRFSHLKLMCRSAAHCKHAMGNPSLSTAAQQLGAAAHSLILGGAPVSCYPGKVRRGKEFDAWLADQPPDAIVLLENDHDRANSIAAAVNADKHASRLLSAPGTIYEKTILWDQDGRARRGTPDARTATTLVDLKTCRTSDPERFKWDAIKYAYHAQLADYSAAMAAETGSAPTEVYIVAVESLPPYAVSVHRLTPGALNVGARLCRTWLERFRQCELAGVWPGYSESIVDLDVHDQDLELTFAEDDE